jgi:hypothetical protein
MAIGTAIAAGGTKKGGYPNYRALVEANRTSQSRLPDLEMEY